MRAHPASRRDFRPGGRTRIIDRRGRTLHLCTPADLPAQSPPRVRDAVKRANAHRWGPAAISAATSLSIYVGVSIPMRAFGGWSWSKTFDALLPLCIVVVLFTGVSVVFGVFWARRKGLFAVSECLLARVCPSCGYDLATCSPDADGSTMCPECGGVWPDPRKPAPAVPRCGTCGYDLEGLAVRADGRIGCPECGASAPASRAG